MPKMCPDDQLPLYERTVHGLVVDICLKCGGLWLDRGEIARLRDMKTEELKEFDDATPTTHAPRSTQPKCPVCNQVLEPFNYCGGEARLERCVVMHGIWVPEEQLMKIAKPFSPEAAMLLTELNVKQQEQEARHRVVDEVLRQLSWRRGWSRWWHW